MVESINYREWITPPGYLGYHRYNFLMTWAIRTIYSQIGLHVPFYAETMLNQWLYHTINYFEPNTKSKGDGNHPVLVADVTINSLVA